MIIKSFLNKLKFSKYMLLIIILCFISGLIKEIFAVILLILFHEFGHFIMSYHYNWKIKEITIYPFGGLIKYEEMIDKPLTEEFLITISGPLNQLIIFLIIFILHKRYLISDYFYTIFKNYNICMLLFNLLPIIPLDGSKILNILFNKIFSFKLSYKLLQITSFFIMILFIIKYIKNYSYIIIVSFLIIELIKYIKNKNIIFNRFLFEKYLYKNKYNKYYKIKDINKMKRNKKHLIKYKNHYLTETDYIKKIKGV